MYDKMFKRDASDLEGVYSVGGGDGGAAKPGCAAP